MARTDRKQRPASPGIDLAGKKPASPGAILTLTASALAVLWAVALLTEPGRVGYAYAFFFLEFFGGVFTLVGLTLTVMIGLLATDRLVLQPRQRVWIQSAHRTLGIISVSCLAIHILTKVSEGRASATGSVVPFLGTAVAGQSVLYVGLGPVAGYLMVAVLWTGLIRRRFAGTGRPWMWRALHSTAYLSWPVALLHGLGAGRPPATWVTLSYLACVLAVAIALLLRLSVGSGRRVQGGRLATTTMSSATGAIRPVGKLAPAAARRRGAGSGAEMRPERSRYGDTQFVAERLEPAARRAAVEDGLAPAARSRRAAVGDRPVIDSTWRDSDATPAETAGQAWRAALDAESDPGRRRTAEEPAAANGGSRAARRAGGYPAERPGRSAIPEPPRRRPRSADEYLVAPSGAGRDERIGSAASYGPPPSRRAEREADERTTGRGATRRPRRSLDEELPGPAGTRREERLLDDRPPTRAAARHAEAPPAPSPYPETPYPETPYPDTRQAARRRAAGREAEPVRDAPRRAGRPADEQPRYRATAPAPPYIPAPSPVDDLVPELDPLPADDTPTLVDLASRRAIRDAVRERDAAREAATKARRARRRKTSDKDDADEEYWGYLRGEAR